MTWISNQPGLARLQPPPNQPAAGPELPPPLPNGVVRVTDSPQAGQAPVWNGTQWQPEDTLAYTGEPTTDQALIWNDGAWTPTTLLPDMIQGDWETFDPTVTSAEGAISGYNAVGSYLPVTTGLTVIAIGVEIVNAGTASGNMLISTPPLTQRVTPVTAACVASTNPPGKFVAGFWQGTEINLNSKAFDGTTIWISDSLFEFTLAVPATST